MNTAFRVARSLVLTLSAGRVRDAGGLRGLRARRRCQLLYRGHRRGLVFKIRRTDNGVSTQSAGDIASLVYNGVEYQDQSRGSQVNSGFDYLYSGVSAVTVDAAVVQHDSSRSPSRRATSRTTTWRATGTRTSTWGPISPTEPDTLGLCRYIVRIPSRLLPNGPHAFRHPQHHRDRRVLRHLRPGRRRDPLQALLQHAPQGLVLHRRDREPMSASGSCATTTRANSGGPFYRSLLNQCGSDQEITYIVNYGEAQTEAFRTSILNSYALVFTNGAAPTCPSTTPGSATWG